MKLLVAWCLASKTLAEINVSSHLSELNASTQLKQSANNTQAAASSSAPHRARLDVGFASFENDTLNILSLSFKNSTLGTPWTDNLKKACLENVSNSVREGLKAQLKPLKTLIGKTWMSLPEDDQRDAYVAQLKASYAPDFKDYLQSVESHVQRSFRHLGVISRPVGKRKISPEQLLSQCEVSVAGNLVNERCYDKDADQTFKKAPSFLQMRTGAQNKFCMPSVFEALAHRLHDSQGLIGMTMQFESKSMSIAPSASAVNDIVQQASAIGH